MRTEYEIYMDFKRVEEQIERLRGIASKMSSLALDDLAGTLQNIGNSWKGDNADTYLTKGGKVKSDIASTADEIRNTADSIEAMAIRIRDAELKAIVIAETLL